MRLRRAHDGPATIGETIAVIPCSKEKVWDDGTHQGPALAGEAYTSELHRVAQAYAEAHADRWLVLSALHGLLAPDDSVPGPYDVTFSRSGDPVISDAALAAQARQQGLMDARVLIVACPDDYAERLKAAVGPGEQRWVLPLAGVPLDELDQMSARLARLQRDPP